jgi:hypothetical protein
VKKICRKIFEKALSLMALLFFIAALFPIQKQITLQYLGGKGEHYFTTLGKRRVTLL